MSGPDPNPATNPAADDVRRVAELAMLELREDEVPDQARRLAAILHHVETLRSLDLEGVEPMAYPCEFNAPLVPDEPAACADPDALLRGAPSLTEFASSDGTEARYVRVPKVLGEGSA